MFDWFSSLGADGEPENHLSIEEKEEEFNNVVRENIIVLLTFITLYIIAYCIIAYLHRKRERDGWYGGEDEAKVYRISLYLCAVTLAVSILAVFLLPMSMIGNEIVHLFPDSYWVQWLNGALIHNLWNWTYALSNLSLFALLPFSYFFTESEGFSGQRRGLLPRVYETVTVLSLLAVLVFGLAVLALAFFDRDNSGLELLKMVGEYYVQYLYSFLLCGFVIIMLTLCAPFGMTLLFDAVEKLLVKPKIFEKSEEDMVATRLEEDALKRKLHSHNLTYRGSKQDRDLLKQQVDTIQKKRKELERRQNASPWERNVGYPLVMLLLILLTALAFVLVCFHILELVFIGDNELYPQETRSGFRTDYRSFMYPQQPSVDKNKRTWWSLFSSRASPEDEARNRRMSSLGATSLSAFGIVGTLLEVAIIYYLMLASVLGLYSLPLFKRMRPEKRDTSMTGIIFNCFAVQLLSSSLPVLCRILGITEFDLQGNYGQFTWLGSFYFVFLCNLVFAAITAFFLMKKVTIKMRTELYKALGLDKSKTWTSGWSSKDATDRTPNCSPPPSPRPSSARETEEWQDCKSELSVTTAELPDDSEGGTSSGKLIIEKLEEIDKMAMKISSESKSFLNHDQHLHDTTHVKENDIARR